MKDIYVLSLLAIGLPLLFYVLWINGYMVLSAKRAVLFIGSVREKNRCKVTFSSCSGFVKRVIKFSDNRSYEFIFDSTITKGNVSVEILNRNKEAILTLNPSVPTAAFIVNEKERYYLVLRFDKAAGEYKLTWN